MLLVVHLELSLKLVIQIIFEDVSIFKGIKSIWENS